MAEQDRRPTGTANGGVVIEGPHQSQCCSKLRELFGIDLRSLAVFRICTAFLILVDLLLRSRFIEANYTDAGVLPRTLVDPHHPFFFLHSMSGAYSFQCLCFILTAVFTVMLLVGYRTTLATVAVWFLLACMQFRNPFLLDGQDILPRQLLFWSMFLPLGARFSIDARRNPQKRRNDTSVLSAASVALLCQFVFVYVTGGLVKTSPDWQAGTVLDVVLSNQNWTLPFGQFLLQFPQWVLKLLTWGVLYLEIFGPFLMFLPVCTGPTRMLTICAFWILQLGFGLSIELRLFPFISSLATLPFIPVWFWNKVGTRVREHPENEIPVPTESGSPTLGAGSHRWLIRVREGVVCLFLLFATLLNLHTIGIWTEAKWLRLPDRITKLDLGYYIGMNQNWNMYAGPVTHEPTYVLIGTQRDGTELEFLKTPGDADWEKVRRLHGSYRFRLLHGPIIRLSKRYGTPPHVYLDWLCRKWNTGKMDDQKLASIKVFCDLRDIRPGKPGQLVRKLVVEHQYSSES